MSLHAAVVREAPQSGLTPIPTEYSTASAQGSPTGSGTRTNTSGTVRVACSSAGWWPRRATTEKVPGVIHGKGAAKY